MQILATTAQMRELDRTAIEELGIPSLLLMECAAQQAADCLWSRISGQTNPRVALFCGPGNNGGDGIAAARLLMEKGCEVKTLLVGDRDKMTADARAMEQLLVEAGGELEDYQPDDFDLRIWLTTCDGVMDALFGVGLAREVSGAFLAAIQQINRLRSPLCPVVSCDIPSGLHGDTGEVMGAAVRADVTVTFSVAKPGLYLGQGEEYAGEIFIAPIGIPGDLLYEHLVQVPNALHATAAEDGKLPRRPRSAHKGEFGRVFVLAGSEGYTGAPVLATRAAVRSGAGLVFLGVPRDIYPIVAVKCDEAMPFPLPEDYDALLAKAQGCDVALIGPGLGRAGGTEELVHRLLTDLEIPVVLDADGINALEGHIDILDRRTAPTVLTPHDGEFQRLSGCALPIHDRLSAARAFAQAHNCVLVLKGHGTITAAPSGEAWLCTAGNPGMAKGGCGDVLAGMTAALLGQKHLRSAWPDLAQLAATAVLYHAQAGDLCAQQLGEYAMTPSDMLDALPEVLHQHE